MLNLKFSLQKRLANFELAKLFKYSLFLFVLLGHSLHATSHTLLVTGCGRSGTNYMAEYLEKSGYKIFHERLGDDGVVSWPMAVNSLSPWGPLTEDSFNHVFHQVKHPLPVLTSWIVNIYDLNRDEWMFIRKHIPEINLDDTLIVQCAKYWYYWNLLVEKQAEWRYRIEDLEKILPEFIDRSGLVLDSELIHEIPSNFNTWKDTTNKITWADLKLELPYDLYQNIQAMALRYGYNIND